MSRIATVRPFASWAVALVTAGTPGQVVATLRPDALDAPAPTSVEEAARSTKIADEMGGHSMSHGTYVHVDAGRAAAPSPAAPHHVHPAPPKPSPQPSPKTKENR